MQEIFLITYDFKIINSSFEEYKLNYFEGIPRFNYVKLEEEGIKNYKLNECLVETIKYDNALVVLFFEEDLSKLYWIKTDNIYYGLEKNALRAVVYDVPEGEKHIVDRL